jgi:hypothetical protein
VRYVGVSGMLRGVGLRHDTTLRTPALPGFSEPPPNSPTFEERRSALARRRLLRLDRQVGR